MGLKLETILKGLTNEKGRPVPEPTLSTAIKYATNGNQAGLIGLIAERPDVLDGTDVSALIDIAGAINQKNLNLFQAEKQQPSAQKTIN